MGRGREGAYGPEMRGRDNKRRNGAKEPALGSLQLRRSEKQKMQGKGKEREREEGGN
jgi:hypothetical protein